MKYAYLREDAEGIPAGTRVPVLAGTGRGLCSVGWRGKVRQVVGDVLEFVPMPEQQEEAYPVRTSLYGSTAGAFMDSDMWLAVYAATQVYRQLGSEVVRYGGKASLHDAARRAATEADRALRALGYLVEKELP